MIGNPKLEIGIQVRSFSFRSPVNQVIAFIIEATDRLAWKEEVPFNGIAKCLLNATIRGIGELSSAGRGRRITLLATIP